MSQMSPKTNPAGASFTKSIAVSPGIWKASAQEFHSIRVITTCGVLAALGVVLKYVASIDIGQFIRIGISGIPDLITAAMFGPVVGGIFGAVLDILKYIVEPNGPFFPGFTLNAALTAVIFGMILYRKKVTFLRVLIAEIITKVTVSMFLTAVWLSVLYGQAFTIIFTARIISCLVMIPIDAAITYAILKLLRRFWRTQFEQA